MFFNNLKKFILESVLIHRKRGHDDLNLKILNAHIFFFFGWHFFYSEKNCVQRVMK